MSRTVHPSIHPCIHASMQSQNAQSSHYLISSQTPHSTTKATQPRLIQHLSDSTREPEQTYLEHHCNTDSSSLHQPSPISPFSPPHYSRTDQRPQCRFDHLFGSGSLAGIGNGSLFPPYVVWLSGGDMGGRGWLIWDWEAGT
ncbi:hypothetical protein BDV06DRAFT_160633 [Aspergillus oleicola]